MVIYILLGLIFLLIIGLFVLVLKPQYSQFLIKIINGENKIVEDSFKTNMPSFNNYTENRRSIFLKLRKTILKELEKISDLSSKITANGERPLINSIKECKDYLNRLSENESYLLDAISVVVEEIISEEFDKNPIKQYNYYIIKIEGINDLLRTFFSSNSAYSSIVKKFYETSLLELNSELIKFRKLKNILSNSSTIDVYNLEVKKNKNSYWIYLFCFFFTIFTAFLFTYFSISFKQNIVGIDDKNIIDYWILKASGIFISITLITFFLKQAIHHQKKRDQVEKIMLELKALPVYMTDLKPEDAINLRKELATKYFGSSNDGSNLNEIGNIISEQLKNSTEVAKSSAEVIKVLVNKNN